MAHFIDVNNNYIGAYYGGVPEGGIEVPTGPDDARQKWDPVNSVWLPLTDTEVRSSMMSLTPRQLRLGLLSAGITSATVEAQIAAIADDTERATAEIEWNFASTYSRLHPLVVSVGAALGLTETQIDTMWTQATTL